MPIRRLTSESGLQANLKKNPKLKRLFSNIGTVALQKVIAGECTVNEVQTKLHVIRRILLEEDKSAPVSGDTQSDIRELLKMYLTAL